ncbi:hypothetical protein BDF14DRAFT_33957 [Spinellus fusiger]|nr:hypothetical protein BDF14DRAFT_33957 [Spinellus fusiger]
MKIHQQLALQRRTSNSTMNSGSTHREQPSLVPTPHQQPMESMLVDMQQLNKQINGMVYQLIGKYTTLEQCVKTVTDKYQLPPLEEKRLIDLCRELHNDTYTLFNQLNDDVNSMVDRTAAQCHPLLPTPLDASSVSHTSNASDTDMKKKLEQVHLERNYWHKKASELNQRLADSLHR